VLVNVGVRLARRVNSGDGGISNGTSNGNSDGSNRSRTVRRQWTQQRAASRAYIPAPSLFPALRARCVMRARAKNPARVDSPNRNGTGTVRPPCRRRSRILLPSPERGFSLSLSPFSLVPSSLSLSLRRSAAISLSLSLSPSPLSFSLLSMYGK